MANLKQVKDSKAQSMGLHKEVLTGRTQQVFFNPEEAENFFIMVHVMLILIKEQKWMQRIKVAKNLTIN